jgi:hypothetical protein
MATTHMTEWIEEIEKDPRAHDEWHAKYREHFRSGKGLREIHTELRELGVVSDHDVAYMEAIPPEIHAEIAAIVTNYLERDDRWRFRWHHDSQDYFAVRVDAHPSERIVWITLVGPHGDQAAAS